MIGERLQELRKDHGVSQAQLAELLGVSHYTISSYECNRVKSTCVWNRFLFLN